VAADPQPAASGPCCWLVFVAVAVGVFGAPAEALAHGTAPVTALDFEARITSVGGAAGSIEARVIDGDRKLELRVKGSQTVVVLGYAGEPFLRFAGDGVAVNQRSLTAVTNKLVKRGSLPALDSHAVPAWFVKTSRHSFAWHDHRLGPKPGHRYGEGDVAGWAIPVVVDGTPERIIGRLWHAQGPPLWPWLVLLGVTLSGAAALLTTRSRRVLEGTAIGGAALTGASALLLSIAGSLAPGRPATAAWANIGIACFGAGLGFALFAFAPQARVAVAGIVALFAWFVALGYLGVLVHGYVIALLPAAVVRAATAAGVSAGLLALTSVAVFFLVVDTRRPLLATSSHAAPQRRRAPKRRARR
jgi:hypothetical protein